MNSKKVIIFFVSIAVLLLLTLGVARFIDNNNYNGSNLNIQLLEKSGKELRELDNEFAPNRSIVSIPASLIENNMININSFCSLTDSKVVANTVKFNEFAFDLFVDDYIVIKKQNEFYANFEVLATQLGFMCKFYEDNYYLSRLYATKRLMMSGSNLSAEQLGCEKIVKIDDVSVLQYQTEYETHLAMSRFIDNRIDVEIDSRTSFGR